MASPTMIVPPAVVGQSSLDFDVDLLQVQQQVQATTPAGGANGTGVASLSLDPHSGMQSPVIERMASEGEMRREFEGQPPAASAPKRRLEEQSPPGHGAVYQPTNGHAYHASQPGVGFVSQHLSELDQFDDQQQQHQAKRQRTFDQHASDEHKYDTSTHHQQIAAAYPAHPASNSQSQSQSQGRTRRPRHGKHVGRRSSSESDHSSDSRPSSRGSNSSGTSSSSSDDDEDQEQQRARRGRAADQLRGDQPLAHEEADAGDLSHPVDDSGQALFTCQTAHVDTIVHLLTSLVLEKDQVVKASIGVMGIKIVAEQKGSLVCAKAYLKKEIFSTYEVNPARLTQARGLRVGGGGGFEYSLFISLPMLLSCLQLFGSGSDLGASAPVLDMQIAGENDPLELTLTGSDGAGHPYTTKCSLSSLSPDSHQHIGEGFKFGADKLIGCVITSSQLRQAFAELDIPGAEKLHIRAIVPKDQRPVEEVEIHMDVHVGGLSVSTELLRGQQLGVFWENKIDLPHRASFVRSYSLASMRPCIKALAKASMSNFRINKEGLLSIQHIIDSPNKTLSANWIEYFASAVESDRAHPELDDTMQEEANAEMQHSQHQQPHQQQTMHAQGQAHHSQHSQHSQQ